MTGARGIPVGYAALAASYLVVAIGLGWVLRRLARDRSSSHPTSQPETGTQLEPV